MSEKHDIDELIQRVQKVVANTHFTDAPLMGFAAEGLIQLARIADALESLVNIHDTLTSMVADK